jgi:peroxiredoxin
MKDQGAEVIAIGADSPADGQKLALEMKLTFPILSDFYRSLIREYGVLHPTENLARPSMFLVNKEGRIVWKYVGMEASERPPTAMVLQQIKSVK